MALGIKEPEMNQLRSMAKNYTSEDTILQHSILRIWRKSLVYFLRLKKLLWLEYQQVDWQSSHGRIIWAKELRVEGCMRFQMLEFFWMAKTSTLKDIPTDKDWQIWWKYQTYKLTLFINPWEHFVGNSSWLYMTVVSNLSMVDLSLILERYFYYKSLVLVQHCY